MKLETKMKPLTRKTNGKAGFTIIELLTVMSVIIILIGLLVPALNMVKRFARKVTQKNQFHAIGVGLETFNAEWDGYPPSEPRDENGNPYCGAMKLCEAMLGQDMLGFHPDAAFILPDQIYRASTNDRSSRRNYIKLEQANAYRLGDIYDSTRFGSTVRDNFSPAIRVLCDVYPNVTHRTTGRSIGMPILYYRADLSGTRHSVRIPYYGTATEVNSGVSIDDPANIYDYQDNDDLVRLGIPWQPGPAHLMASGGGTTIHDPPLNHSSAQVFYNKIWNDQLLPNYRPYNGDTYILLSAGFDGEYGTDDDVFDFRRQ